jgi:hypothetical protein
MTTVPEPGVTISLRSIYEKLTRVETVANRTAADVKAIKGAQHDHEERLRELEESRWPWKVIAGLVSIGGLIVAAIGLMLKG